MLTPFAWTLKVRISPRNSWPDFLKLPMFAMSLLLGARARDHRGLAGDLQAEGDRRRTRLRAVAQRRMAAVRLSCLPRGMGEAQGKKVEPTPLRQRRSRRSRPLARSSHQRPRGSRDRQQSTIRVADITAGTRRRFPWAKKKKPSRTQGRYRILLPGEPRARA